MGLYYHFLIKMMVLEGRQNKKNKSFGWSCALKGKLGIYLKNKKQTQTDLCLKYKCLQAICCFFKLMFLKISFSQFLQSEIVMRGVNPVSGFISEGLFVSYVPC